MDFTHAIKKKILIIGAGLAGLQCAQDLIKNQNVDTNDILILEASSYIGGRIHQNNTFIPWKKLDMGAEIIHGVHNELHEIAKKESQSITPLFVWAHGDGGPMDHAVDGNFGLYYCHTHKKLYRFDDEDESFQRINTILSEIGDMDVDKELGIENDITLKEYLLNEGIKEDMLGFAAAGFANTMCSDLDTLSLQTMIQWSKLWDASDGEDEGDYRPDHTFAYLIEHLSPNLNIRLDTPVRTIRLVDKGNNESSEVQLEIATKTKREINAEEGVAGEGETGVVGEGETEMLAETIRAEVVVVTASAHVLKPSTNLLSFEPPLSKQKLKVLDKVQMRNAIKVICAFSSRPWPEKLHGMIFAGCTIPEIWFNDCPKPEGIDSSDTMVCYACGFLTAGYAESILKQTKTQIQTQNKEDEDRYMNKIMVDQLDMVFGLLEDKHLNADPSSSSNVSAKSLPKASDVFVKGMVYNWSESHPYVGGGYSSWTVPKTRYTNGHSDSDDSMSTDILLCQKVLAQPISIGTQPRIFFAGEATNTPGVTAHAALESGRRAAQEIISSLL